MSILETLFQILIHCICIGAAIGVTLFVFSVAFWQIWIVMFFSVIVVSILGVYYGLLFLYHYVVGDNA